MLSRLFFRSEAAGAPAAVPAAEPLAPAGEALVEQAIDRRARGRFLKEVLAAPIERGALSLVRKRAAAAGGPRRGAVLLIHGYAQNRYAWHVSQRSLANYLAADGFDVFNVDLRGVGRSRGLGSPAARGFEDFVEGDLPAVVDAVRAASGEARVFLVGHSLGAAIACAFAGRAAERVRGVVTLAGLYRFGRGNRFVRMLGRAAAMLDASGAAPFLPAQLRTDLVGRALRLSRRAWDSPLGAFAPLQAWYPGSMEDDVLHESIERSFEPASREVTLSLARMATGGRFCDAAGACYFERYEALRDLPLLVATGSADALVSPGDSGAAFERSASRDKTLRPFDEAFGGCGWGHIDLVLGRNAPAHVWPVIRDWLRAR